MEEAEEPHISSITDIAPEIANAINGLAAEVARLNTKVAMLSTRLDRISRGQRVLNALQAAIQQADQGVNAAEAAVIPETDQDGDVVMAPALARPAPPVIAATARYSMKRDPTMTVMDLWTEYNVGLDGGPAVRELETTDKSWRSGDERESGFFRKRRTILDEIDKMIANGLSEEAAVNVMEQRKGEDRTLDWLVKDLRRERTAARRD